MTDDWLVKPVPRIVISMPTCPGELLLVLALRLIADRMVSCASAQLKLLSMAFMIQVFTIEVGTRKVPQKLPLALVIVSGGIVKI